MNSHVGSLTLAVPFPLKDSVVVLAAPQGKLIDETTTHSQAEHEQIIKNLQRENAMIATAWYDLTSRLQSNHVVLQRKDQPKSWLNKQRHMVNGESSPTFLKTGG